jgi:hypothetical protein
MCDYRRGIDWMNGFIDHLYTRLGTTGNYSAIAVLHNSQITVPTKHFPACCVLTSRFLATASNSGDSSASCAQVLLSQSPVQSSCLSLSCRAQLHCQPSTYSLSLLNSPLSINSQLTWGPRYITSGQTQQKTPFLYCCVRVRFRGNVFTGRYKKTAVCQFAYCITTTAHATVSVRGQNYGTSRKLEGFGTEWGSVLSMVIMLFYLANT